MKTVLCTLNAKYIHASLALRSLKAYAKLDFPDIELAEFTIKDVPNQIVADIYRLKPDVVAFSVYIWNVEESAVIIDSLRQVMPHITIVIGGPEVSYDIRYWMKRLAAVDFLVFGEGEVTFAELLTAIQANTAFNSIAGLAWRDGEQITVNPPRQKIDMNALRPAYGDMTDVAQLVNRVVYYETSRGCPFSCQFCLSSIETGVRYLDLERVKLELLALIECGVRTIKFVDRTFNLNRKYALELFQFLIDHRKDTVFQFEITGDILPDEIVDFLDAHAPAGMFRFEIGVQSTNDVTNTLVKRKQNFVKLSRTIQRIGKTGKIVQHLDLIAGLPEEDYRSFRKTFNDVFALKPDELQLGFLKMLRGTGIRNTAEQHGYIYMDRAPYEIVRNNILSYDDVLAIKEVEDVLEKYWNDHRMRKTVQYLIDHVFQTPFDFFQTFGHFWTEQGWQRIGHQLSDLFLRLNKFLEQFVIDDTLEIARAFMKYEYFLGYRVRPQKVWWPRSMSVQERRHYANVCVKAPWMLGEDFKHINLSVDTLLKHAVFEPVACDVLANQPHREQTLLVVYYPPGLGKGENPSAYTIPMRILKEDSA